jgi:hypothetical protein
MLLIAILEMESIVIQCTFLRILTRDLNQLVAKLFMSLSNASDFNSVAIYPFIVKSSGRSYLNEVDHFVPVPMHPQLLKNVKFTVFGFD